jgi:hypothetical protein
MKKKLPKWLLGLIVLPFVAAVVWILLGIFSDKDPVQDRPRGFNTALPQANLSRDSALDKMSFYTAAKQDSIRDAELLQLDPYRSKTETFGSGQLNLPINSFYAPAKRSVEVESVPTTFSFEQNKEPSSLDQKDSTLEAIQQLLDQLASLQQGKDTLVSIGETTTTMVVTPQWEDYFGGTHSTLKSSFYGLEQSAPISRRWMASLPAQVLQNGAVIKIQLLEDLPLSNCLLKAGSFVYGIASVQQERMQVQIYSVLCEDRIIQTQIEVFDVDGMKGISVPDTQSKEVLSTVVDPAMQSLDIPIGYSSVPNKIAMAGMQTAKQLMAKKAKAIRIHVYSGYRVYLYHK